MLREYKVGYECYLVSVTVLFCIRDMSPKAATFYHVFMQSLFRTLSHELYHLYCSIELILPYYGFLYPLPLLLGFPIHILSHKDIPTYFSYAV
jgi:hypothetical protein